MEVRIMSSGFRLSLVLVAFIVTGLVVLLVVVRPPGPGKLPFEDDGQFRLLTDFLGDAPLQEESLRSKLRSFDGSQGWLVLQDGHILKVGKVKGMPLADVPNPCWEGRRCFLLRRGGGLIQFFPLGHDGEVEAAFVWEGMRKRDRPGVSVVLSLVGSRPGTLVLFLILATFTMGFTLLLVGKLDRPLTELRKALHLIAQRDLNFRLSGDQPVDGQSREAFNEMAQRLSDSHTARVEELYRARIAEQSRRDFLLKVSSALKEPLQAVQQRLFEEAAPAAELAKDVHAISMTMRKLLEISRWEQSVPGARFVRLPLAEPFMQAVREVAQSAEESGCALQLEGIANSEVFGDRNWLRELFRLLLEDAVRRGACTLSVVVIATEQGSLVRLSDDGCFELSGEHEVCLSICAKILDIQGGRLALDRSKGFAVELFLRGSDAQ